MMITMTLVVLLFCLVNTFMTYLHVESCLLGEIQVYMRSPEVTKTNTVTAPNDHLECWMQCSMTHNCHSINYRPHDGLCEMVTKYPYTVENDIDFTHVTSNGKLIKLLILIIDLINIQNISNLINKTTEIYK